MDAPAECPDRSAGGRVRCYSTPNGRLFLPSVNIASCFELHVVSGLAHWHILYFANGDVLFLDSFAVSVAVFMGTILCWL